MANELKVQTVPAPGFQPPSVDFGSKDSISLQRRFVFGVGIIAVALLLIAAWASDYFIARTMLEESDKVLADAAHRSVLLVDRSLAERRRQVEMIAASPTILDAARKGADVSRQHGLPSLSIETLEQRFKATRSQQVDDRALSFLRELLPKLDIAEVMVTDEYGYNAVTTSPSSDFVQSDEAWWQRAWKDGWTPPNALPDPATNQVVIELSRVISTPSPSGGMPSRYGVVKTKYGLSSVDSALMQGSTGTALRVDLIDASGRLIASSGGGKRFRTISGIADLGQVRADSVFRFDDAGATRRGVIAPAYGGAWRVVAHMDEGQAVGAYRTARGALLLGVVVVLLVIVGGLMAVNGFIERRISRPAAELALLAEAIAAGDLSAEVTSSDSGDEIGRLARAIRSMVNELRRLATAMKESAHETASMSAEITAGSEEMAAAAGEIATTASDLSRQSTIMAETIQSLASSSESLANLAIELDAGAHEGVQRNAHLKELALENRTRLHESSEALEALSNEVQLGATAVEQLADASVEVRTFVALVGKLARQSKLLALNAAMEAARAGEHGEGFAVVASEVRRLAAMSAEAAERTQRVVTDVLAGIEQSRASSERMVATVRTVRAATELGSRSFDEIEQAVVGTEAWTSSVEQTAKSARTLADEVRSRTESLNTGTESFAAAMQQVAASSEEQSASTQEIAAAAATLAVAADRLAKIVAHLRLEAATELPNEPPPAEQQAPMRVLTLATQN
jgi:methyl-accepting chemotaxis protein